MGPSLFCFGAGAGTAAGTAGAALFLATLTVDGVAATLLLLGAGENREEDDEDDEDDEDEEDEANAKLSEAQSCVKPDDWSCFNSCF